jgi:hypothetical protein
MDHDGDIPNNWFRSFESPQSLEDPIRELPALCTIPLDFVDQFPALSTASPNSHSKLFTDFPIGGHHPERVVDYLIHCLGDRAPARVLVCGFGAAAV